MRSPLAGLALLGALAPLASAAAIGHQERAVQSSVEASSPFAMPLCNGQKVFEATITDLQDLFKSGHLTSRQLVECYFARADLIDGSAKTILERNPDALGLAHQMDRERKEGKTRGAMQGIPVLTKVRRGCKWAHRQSS